MGCVCGGTHGCRPTRHYFVGADDPVRPGPVTQHFVGQGPCALPWVREKSGSGRCRHRPLRRGYKECDAGRNPPVTASPCQPPLGKGAKGTRRADCHSQCAHWLRNDREFYRGAVQVRITNRAGVYPGPVLVLYLSAYPCRLFSWVSVDFAVSSAFL